MKYSPDYFIHAANILLLVAYSVRDILWLRLFAVAAGLVSIPFLVLRDGQVLGIPGSGPFVDAALLLNGLQAEIEAVVETPVRAMRWQVDTL